MSVKAEKWGTFIAPFDVTIPANINAYTATGVKNNRVTLSAVETTIPANTPVILYNTSGENISETFYGDLHEEDSYTVGLLTGVYTAATILADANHYVLQTQNDIQAFYSVDEAFTATAYKCYLTYNAGGGVKMLSFDFGTATGINSIANSQQPIANSSIFNLAGQRMSKMQKGVNIVNGKKVLVK